MGIQTRPIALITLSILILVVHSVVISGNSDAGMLGQLGDSQPITNPSDRKVVKIGEYAVAQHNKFAKTNLKFQRVVNGSVIRLFSGKYYRLVISAMDGYASHDYLSLVYEKPWQHLNILISFKIISTSI